MLLLPATFKMFGRNLKTSFGHRNTNDSKPVVVVVVVVVIVVIIVDVIVVIV